jgi:hypothetical protein
MKFYETHFEDYCKGVEKHNIHPDITFPKEPTDMIVYGSSGVGKYSQILRYLKTYSPSQLKYDKKIKFSTEKQSYKCRMSDVHFEIDMSLLGCNSKVLWHEIYSQIVDIITVRPEKLGFIVCKNFHCIHNELLDIFYSYMQNYCHGYEGRCREVQVRFILVTEHLSFIPNSILDHCSIVRVARPSVDAVSMCCKINKDKVDSLPILHELDSTTGPHLMNLKEVYSFALIDKIEQIPKDNFNMVCDALVDEMTKMIQGEGGSLTQFRDMLYDILIYNLDGMECIWYIYGHFMKEGAIDIESESNKKCMHKLMTIFKQYSNNYRSIFHLENAVFTILEAISHHEI